VALYHFSGDINGNDPKVTLDPSNFGKHRYTAGDKKASGLPRTFFYLDPNDREPMWFSEKSPMFTTHVHADKIYDLHTDPENRKERAHSIHHLLTDILNDGFHGVYYETAFPTVNLFHPVEAVRKLARKAKANSNDVNALGLAYHQAGDTPEAQQHMYVLADALEESRHPTASYFRRAQRGQHISWEDYQDLQSSHVAPRRWSAPKLELPDGHRVAITEEKHPTDPTKSILAVYRYMIGSYGQPKHRPQEVDRYIVDQEQHELPHKFSRSLAPLEIAKAYSSNVSDQPSMVKLNPVLSNLTARLYQRMEHEPNAPDVKASYDALKRETLGQYNHLLQSGVKVEPWKGEGQPYRDSKEMVADARSGHLWHFTGGDMPKDHPLSEDVPGHPGLTYNDIFRAVHDYFGHAVHGHQFGPLGEFRAWHEHAKMYSPEARPALTTETHGQNSWVNFGPHKALPVLERPYAEQKAGIMKVTNHE
jgi:hypothetical protein